MKGKSVSGCKAMKFGDRMSHNNKGPEGYQKLGYGKLNQKMTATSYSEKQSSDGNGGNAKKAW